MKPLKGIDVSKWQGVIDWDKVAPQIDFAILRAGFGKGVIDTMFHKNADECKRLNIPFGMYWFSYALSPEMARDEADFICSIAKDYKPVMPIIFDYEDDSENYALKNGKEPTNADRLEIAKAFLLEVKKCGFMPCLYVNIGQYNSYANKIDYFTNNIYLWIAQWYSKEPSVPCHIWQYTDDGKINGINGNVDLNYSYVDFRKGLVTNYSDSLDYLKEEIWQKYLKTAKEVIAGKYDNGQRRVELLHEADYNPELVQKIVNILLKVNGTDYIK